MCVETVCTIGWREKSMMSAARSLVLLAALFGRSKISPAAGAGFSESLSLEERGDSEVGFGSSTCLLLSSFTDPGTVTKVLKEEDAGEFFLATNQRLTSTSHRAHCTLPSGVGLRVCVGFVDELSCLERKSPARPGPRPCPPKINATYQAESKMLLWSRI
jgi:hypothetical protein